MYDIEHVCPLSSEQKHKFADAITTIHSEKFTTPRLFVNVNFKDISSLETFVGGKPVCLFDSGILSTFDRHILLTAIAEESEPHLRLRPSWTQPHR